MVRMCIVRHVLGVRSYGGEADRRSHPQESHGEGDRRSQVQLRPNVGGKFSYTSQQAPPDRKSYGQDPGRAYSQEVDQRSYSYTTQEADRRSHGQDTRGSYSDGRGSYTDDRRSTDREYTMLMCSLASDGCNFVSSANFGKAKANNKNN